MKVLRILFYCNVLLCAATALQVHTVQKQATEENRPYVLKVHNAALNKVYCVFAVIGRSNTLTDPIHYYEIDPDGTQSFTFTPLSYKITHTPTLFVTTQEHVFLKERLIKGNALPRKNNDIKYYAVKIPHKTGSLCSGGVDCTVIAAPNKKDPDALSIKITKNKDFTCIPLTKTTLKQPKTTVKTTKTSLSNAWKKEKKNKTLQK